MLYKLDSKSIISIIQNHITPTGLLSSDGLIIYANHTLCQLLEYSSEELYHLQINELTHPVDMDIDSAMYQKCLSRDIDSFSVLKRYITKQEKIIHVKTFNRALYDNNGQLICFILYVLPIDNLVKDVEDKIIKIDFLSLIRNNIKEFIILCITTVGIAIGIGTTFYIMAAKVEHLESIQQSTIDMIEKIINVQQH